MAYFAPYIDASGFHMPTYNDIIEELINEAKIIFGSDIYLENDSQDYQLISVFASKIYDAFQAAQIVYNSRGPSTAIGAALASLVKINGIKPKAQSYSICNVTLSGIEGSIVTNGIVADTNGILWDLPNSVAIGIGGTVSVEVICQKPGPIMASPGDIKFIVTPTYGWTSVINQDMVKVGSSLETDSQLRARQAISTAQPSRTVLEGTKGAIAAIQGVNRFKIYENDTNAIDSNGLPANSITAVVEGGLDDDIAKTLFLRKGPGCYTNGDIEIIVTDEYDQPTTIRFYRPSYTDLDVVINVKQLPGYSSENTQNIKKAIVDFINSMPIGVNTIPVNNFYGPALLTQNLSIPVFSVISITAARHSQSQSSDDIVTTFNEALRGNLNYVTINVT